MGGRVRSSLFSVLADRLPGARVLDLFAGVGGFGLEALSRGAASVDLVEQDRRAASALEAWLVNVGAEGEARVLCRDVFRGRLPAGPYDLVFLDPPYEHWNTDAGASALALAVLVLGPEGLVAAKLPARERLADDPRWHVLRRREVGANAWALVTAPDATNGASRDGDPAPMEGGTGGERLERDPPRS